MFKTLIISSLSFLIFACKTKKQEQNELFDKFNNCFTFRQCDTIKIEINYDTLDKLKKLDTCYLALFHNLETGIFETGMYAWFKFKIDKFNQGILVSNAATGADLKAYLFKANSKIKELEFIDEVGSFYNIHNSKSELKTKIYISKQTLILEKTKKICDFVKNPESPKCDELTRIKKLEL